MNSRTVQVFRGRDFSTVSSVPACSRECADAIAARVTPRHPVPGHRVAVGPATVAGRCECGAPVSVPRRPCATTQEMMAA